MSRFDVQHSDGNFLRRLLSVDDSDEALWGEEELREAWLHQLVTPIDSCGSDDSVKARDRSQAASLTPLELFQGKKASLPELQAMKDAAKEVMAQRRQSMPPQIASVIYHVAIALALRDHFKWISTIDHRKLSEGLAWACKQPWIDAETGAAISRLDPPTKDQ